MSSKHRSGIKPLETEESSRNECSKAKKSFNVGVACALLKSKLKNFIIKTNVETELSREIFFYKANLSK